MCTCPYVLGRVIDSGGKMSSDAVMIALAVAGMALTLVYFFVAVQTWRRQARAGQLKEAAARSLHAERLSRERRPIASTAPSGKRQIAA